VRRLSFGVGVFAAIALQIGCSRQPSRDQIAALVEKRGATPDVNSPMVVLTADWEAARRAGAVVVKKTGLGMEYYAAVKGVPLWPADLTRERDKARLGSLIMYRGMGGLPLDGLTETGTATGPVGLIASAIKATVTGIRNDNDKVLAEFSWTPELPPSLAQCNCFPGGLPASQGKATLAKYDDGWRVVDVAWW
jgi:hypothetical protein